MSVDYTLLVGRPGTGDDVDPADELARLVQGTVNAYGVVLRPGLTVSAHRPGTAASDIRAAVIREELYGFRPMTIITFSPSAQGGDEEYRTALELLVTAAAIYVTNHDADAALLLNGELLIFRRREGVLELNDVWTPWTALDLVARVADRLGGGADARLLLTPLHSPAMNR
jgi:hypothetical protein